MLICIALYICILICFVYIYTHTRVFEYSPAVVSRRGGGYVFVEAFILSMLKYTSVYVRDTVYISKEVSINRHKLGCPPAQDASHHQDY